MVMVLHYLSNFHSKVHCCTKERGKDLPLVFYLKTELHVSSSDVSRIARECYGMSLLLPNLLSRFPTNDTPLWMFILFSKEPPFIVEKDNCLAKMKKIIFFKI